MKKLIVKLFVSIGITSIISVLIAQCFSNEQFWSVFWLSFIIQILVFYIINTWYYNYLINRVETVKTQRIKELNRNVIKVTCPCSEGYVQAVDYRFDVDENIVVCEKCNKKFKCKATVNTTLVTEPIYFDK